MRWFRAFVRLIPLLLMSSVAKAELDIKPDCSERPIKINEITAIAEKPEVKTMLQFLNALPKDSLQTFTFVANTRSLQHHGVDEQWPRVLRMTADGKIAMAFVCNPESQDYGSVEILHFEDAPTARWHSLSLKFDKREPDFHGVSEKTFTAAGKAGDHVKVSRDSETCLKCHGVGAAQKQLRPIFAAYPKWPGFFGSDDDTLFTNSRELTVFQQFKKLAAQDPCYQTLPWPRKVLPGYEHYPYHVLTKPPAGENPYANQKYIRDLKTTNYHVRPNLKFTDTFSHLLAQRLTWNLLRERDYQRVAPLLAMESLGCKDLDLSSELQKTLGTRYKKPSFLKALNSMDPRSPTSGSLQLYTVAQILGVKPDEWTLLFNDPLNPEFATGVQGAYGQDNSVARLVQSLLLQELAKSVPGLNENFRLSRGVSAFFKDQNFSCIDDLGGAIEFDTAENQTAMCTALTKAYRDGVGEKIPLAARPPSLGAKAPTTPSTASMPSPTLKGVRTTIAQAMTANSQNTAGGGKVLQMYCTTCHGKESYLPSDYRFFTSDTTFKKMVVDDPMLLFRAMAYIQNGRMPLGYKLKDEERRGLQSYLLKIAGGSL